MRAALSILGLVVVLAIVLLMSKKQLQSAAPRAAAPAASEVASPAITPQGIGRQVQDTLNQAAQRASDAQP